MATKTQEDIEKVCENLSYFLIEKNTRYGDSALSPIQCFSKANSSQGICNRIDDKLSRIKNSDELRKNDCVDLLGYLVLLCIDKGWTNFSELVD